MSQSPKRNARREKTLRKNLMIHRLLEERFKHYKDYFKYENWKHSEKFSIKRIGVNACKWDDKNLYFKYRDENGLEHLFKSGKEILSAFSIVRVSSYDKNADCFVVRFDWWDKDGTFGGMVYCGSFKSMGKIHEKSTET